MEYIHKKNDSEVKLEGEMLKPSFNSETMESNLAGFYLAGVVFGGIETMNGLLKTPENMPK